MNDKPVELDDDDLEHIDDTIEGAVLDALLELWDRDADTPPQKLLAPLVAAKLREMADDIGGLFIDANTRAMLDDMAHDQDDE